MTEAHHRAHYEAERAGRLPMWVIYRPTTREYPGRWVARLWHTLPQPEPTEFVMLHDTLEDLREMIPPTCVLLARQDGDAPEIVETWL